jgi:hypothetical protein
MIAIINEPVFGLNYGQTVDVLEKEYFEEYKTELWTVRPHGSNTKYALRADELYFPEEILDFRVKLS